jgi:hypothetical protein
MFERNQAFGLLQDRLTKGGRLCILADGNREPLVLTPAFHAQELEMVGSSDGENYAQYALWFFEQIRRRCPPLEQLYERETTAEMLPYVFEQIAQSENAPVKVLVHYDGGAAERPHAADCGYATLHGIASRRAFGGNSIRGGKSGNIWYNCSA